MGQGGQMLTSRSPWRTPGQGLFEGLLSAFRRSWPVHSTASGPEVCIARGSGKGLESCLCSISRAQAMLCEALCPGGRGSFPPLWAEAARWGASNSQEGTMETTVAPIWLHTNLTPASLTQNPSFFL